MDLAAWLERDPGDWPGMIEVGVSLPTGQEVAAALEPWLSGPGGGDGEVVEALLAALELAAPEDAWWLRLMRLIHAALADVTWLGRSETCRQRPDFADRRARLACVAIGAAHVLATQRVDPDLAERFSGTAALLARTFIEAETPAGGGGD